MRGYSLASAAVGMAALFASTVVADVDPIVIKVCMLRRWPVLLPFPILLIVRLQGSKFFFEGNGTQLYVYRLLKVSPLLSILTLLSQFYERNCLST